MSDVLVKTTGVFIPIEPHNGQYYTLLELQAYVGGNIETVYFKNGKILIIYEEGKLKGKLPNRIATSWLIVEGYVDFVAGDALLIEGEHLR